jgi:hypothetical protein
LRRTRRWLLLILLFALFGTIFSGVLSYREVFGPGAETCPAPGAHGTVFGYPACTYGFFVHLTISGIAVAGLIAGRRSPTPG